MRLRLRAENGDKGAASLLLLLRRPDRVLTTVLFGNNVAVVLASSLLTLAAERYTPEWAAVALATVGATALLTFFSEVVPKTVALNESDLFATAFAKPLRYFVKICSPVTTAATAVTGLIDRGAGKRVASLSREELRAVIAERWGKDPGEAIFKRMIRNAFSFNETTAGEVMTPITDVKAVPLEAAREDVIATVAAAGHSKIPVYQGHVSNYVGVALAKDFLSPRAERVADYVRGVLVVNDKDSVAAILSRLAARTIDMAFVRGEGGGILGVLTLEDILEEIVGEIWDEYDWTYAPARLYPSFVVNGQTPVAALNRRLPHPLGAPGSITLGDFLKRAAGKPLAAGDVVVAAPYRFQVLRVGGGKCRLARVEIQSPEA